MDYIFVTLVSAGNRRIDLKVPNFVVIDELLNIFHESLGITVTGATRIQAEPAGKILDNSRTLQSYSINNGALLTLIYH